MTAPGAQTFSFLSVSRSTAGESASWLRRLAQVTTPPVAPSVALAEPAAPPQSGFTSPVVPAAAPAAPRVNLTVAFFECCESPASQGSWDAVELRWRLEDNVKESDRFATVKLPDDPTSAAYASECKRPMNCEQYIAVDASGSTITIPSGVGYWTRLTSTSTQEQIDWQYQGLASDGDADEQLEVLICGSMTAYQASSWYAYTCEPTASCSIVAHPCCTTGNCVTGDASGGGGVRQVDAGNPSRSRGRDRARDSPDAAPVGAAQNSSAAGAAAL